MALISNRRVWLSGVYSGHGSLDVGWTRDLWVGVVAPLRMEDLRAVISSPLFRMPNRSTTWRSVGEVWSCVMAKGGPDYVCRMTWYIVSEAGPG